MQRTSAYVAVGVLLSLGALITRGGAISVFALGAWALLCAVGLTAAAIRHSGRSRWIFANIAIFAGLAGAGGITGQLSPMNSVPNPIGLTPAELLICGAYLFLTIAIFHAYRIRTTGKNINAWLDALAATSAALLILWTSIYFDLFDPRNLADRTEGILFAYHQIILMAVAGLLVRITATEQHKSTSHRLLTLAVLIVLLGHIFELISVVTSLPAFISLAFKPVALALALAAANHRTVAELESTARMETDRVGSLRLALTAVAIGTPAVIAVFNPPETPFARALTIVLSALIVGAIIARVVRLFAAQRNTAKMESRLASSIGYLSTLEHAGEIRASLADQVGLLFDDAFRIEWVDGDGVEVSPALLHPEEVATHARMNPPTSNPVRNRIFASFVREAGGIASIRSATAEKAAREREMEVRKHIEASERRWRGLVQNSSTALVMLDTNLHVVFASGAVKEILGHPEESYIGHTLEWVTHSKDWDEALQTVLDLLENDPGGRVHFEVRAFDADINTHILAIIVTDMREVEDIEGIVLNIADLTEQRMLESRVHHVANNDPLTLLPNRSAFLDEVSAVLQRSSVSEESVAVAVVNVDEFRVINEGYGTELGDRVLVELALRIRQSVQADDTVARLGGDEFGVLLGSGCTDEEAEMAVASILAAMNRSLQIDGQTLSIRASAGLAVDYQADSTASAMIRRASTALDSAKDGERGHVVLFNEQMGANVAERAEVRDLLGEALREGQLRLVYQPIVNMTTGGLVSFEALARWTHPTRGPISPGVFIPIAESADLITELGEWALMTAAQQIHSWRDQGFTGFTVSVNLSGRQLLEPNIIERIDAIITECEIPYESLTLEITESVLIDDTDLISQRISEIRQLGVALSIDDFGTGYSSLSYLRRYEFDILKIDRSFVSPLGNEIDQRDRVIVKNMITLAQDLGATTVAEGIENESELNALRALGCDRAQGYLFWKPLEVEDATNVLIEALGPAADRAA